MIKYYDQWNKYKSTGDKKARDFLIVHYLPLAKYIASTFPPHTSIYDYDDLVSWACIGLIDAIERFSPEREIKFETYAISRIRGEVVDSLRRLFKSHYPQRRAKIEKTYERLSAKLGRAPENWEMAEALGLTLENYRKWLDSIAPFNILSLEELLETESSISLLYRKLREKSENPLGILEMKELKENLAQAIRELPPRERTIITLYHYEGLTMREIAEMLGVSEGRVSQLHTLALLKLRGKLKKTQQINDIYRE